MLSRTESLGILISCMKLLTTCLVVFIGVFGLVSEIGEPTTARIIEPSELPLSDETFAAATTAITTTWEHEIGLKAMSAISFDWENHLEGWTIEFKPGEEGVLGYTFVKEKRIEVYIRPNQSVNLVSHVIAHELGHAVDVSYNSKQERELWIEVRGMDKETPWWPGNGASDFHTGAGDFAESFAFWQLGDSFYRSKIGSPPTSEQIIVLEQIVNSK